MSATAAPPRTRQQLLFLWTGHASPAGEIVSWSRYDGAADSDAEAPPGDEDRPPYANVVAAMRDGWRVIQAPQPIPPYPGCEHTTSHLAYGYVLERLVESGHG